MNFELTKSMKEFPVTVYSNLEQFTETTSKARCRIFYRGANRNGTFITDEFAEELLKTIPYTPIKGIYEPVDEDFTDHGEKRAEGKIYGVVFENPNFAWEKHLDDDGVEREYGCVDVLLYTALYKEASEIGGKSESMELYDKTLDGYWEVINGQKYYVFTKGCFLGLQVLGDNVEPCFEGAAFYNLHLDLSEIISRIEKYNLNLDKRQGGIKMPVLNFKLSDNQKFNALWSLLNSRYNEENDWIIDYAITDVYDDYALAYNYENSNYERVYYTKNDEEDSLVIDKKEVVYIVDVTESEKSALETIRALNNNTYEKINEVFTALTEKVTELENSNSEFESKISEQAESISTLNCEKEQVTSQYNEAVELLNTAKTSLEEAQNELNTLRSENNELNSFKANIELEEKKAIIQSYSELLSKETLDAYSEKVGEYTALDLDKELAYELKKSKSSIFAKETGPVAYVPKDEPLEGIEAILQKYEKH